MAVQGNRTFKRLVFAPNRLGFNRYMEAVRGEVNVEWQDVARPGELWAKHGYIEETGK